MMNRKRSLSAFSMREKVAARSDAGQSGELGVGFTDWPDDAQHIDPAAGESSFGRECGVSWLLP